MFKNTEIPSKTVPITGPTLKLSIESLKELNTISKENYIEERKEAKKILVEEEHKSIIDTEQNLIKNEELNTPLLVSEKLPPRLEKNANPLPNEKTFFKRSFLKKAS